MLLALADHADDDGFCWPSYVTLSELTGTNPGPKNDCRQAKRTMNNLRKSGELIIWEQQGQHGGRGYTNLYLIITGLSEQEVFEIITRRFELTAAEVPSVITKKGDVYTTLSYLKRVTSETLLRTREAKKGGIDDVQVPKRVVSKAQKGGMDDTRTIIEPSIKPSLTPIGDSGKPPPPGLKTIIKDRFIELTGLTMPTSKSDSGFWWSNFGEILKLARGDPALACKWESEAVGYMQASHLTITGPKSIVGLIGALASGQTLEKTRTNGTHQRNNQQQQRTGQELKSKPTYDKHTDELVYPDGTRVPAGQLP